MGKTGATRGFRLHVGLVGRRNVGKSSLINALLRQDVAIVSPTPGTTTDPVSKPMELQPIGPVLLIDTAGVDDPGELGALRVERTRAQLDRCDVALLVAAGGVWGREEEALLADLRRRGLPVIVVFNQADRTPPETWLVEALTTDGATVVVVSATRGTGLDALRAAIVAA
ncbi:MAG: 50S ribosome-binding GTPase, partial [Krumholzibacteria bacterium]|nr:50S ribosome-binding GTPase [Candidatus Krumholzibacteria bacterium]